MHTLDELKAVLNYDPETGVFTWLPGGRKRKHGDIAGTLNNGYVVLSYEYQSYLAHRIAWLFMTGEWPTQQIDHRDGVRSNNRFKNLRDVSSGENLRGARTLSLRNKSGHTGVSLDKRTGTYTAQRMAHGVSTFLGYFPEIADAIAAYENHKPEKAVERKPKKKEKLLREPKSWHTYCMLAQDIKPYIERIVRRELTIRAVARLLGVTESHLSAVLKKLKVVREPIVHLNTKVLRAARLEFREMKAEQLPIKAAAAAAGCSTRTIYRLKKKAKDGAQRP